MSSSPDATPEVAAPASAPVDAIAAREGDRRIDPRAIARGLRRVASRPEPPWLHVEVARRMAERLSIVLLKPEHVVDWSGWLGAGGEALAAAYPKARRTLVEPTASLASRSRADAHSPWWSARRYIGQTVDVVTEAPASPAQLIWSSMALHAVRNPPALFDQWQGALSADGFVMFSCLGPGTLIELRDLYRREGWGDPMSDFVDMHDLGDMMVQAGFADPVMDQETITLTWDTPAALLGELRTFGVNASPDRTSALRTPRWKSRLDAALRSIAGPDGRIGLSFEVAYGHAFKGVPRRRPDEPTKVSLDEMRSLVRQAGSQGGRP